MTSRTKEKRPRIVCVIPALNEEQSIGRVLTEVKKYVDEIVVVDGGSSDRTFQVARNMGTRTFRQSGNGKGAALRQAFSHAQGDIVIMMDADGSHRPTEIPQALKAIEAGADLVKGSRFLPGGWSYDITTRRRVGNALFVTMVNLLWGTNYTDLCYGFKTFKKEALKKLNLNLQCDDFGIETEICIKARRLGLRVEEVPSVELERTHGRSQLRTFRDGLRILITIVREFLDERRKPGSSGST